MCVMCVVCEVCTLVHSDSFISTLDLCVNSTGISYSCKTCIE